MFIFSSLAFWLRKNTPKHTYKFHHQLQPLLLKHARRIRHCMKSLASYTENGSSWEFLISISPSSCSFCCTKQVCDSHFLHRLVLILKMLVGRKVNICKVLRDEYIFKLCLSEDKRKIGTHLFCGHLELKKFCLSTQYIPRCVYFYKSNPMDFSLKKKQEKRFLMRGN